jgi:predicted RNA-binding protein YlqC (UPF0109 family)
MADLREDFVQYVVKALVSNPDAVSLRRVSDDRGEYLELTVDPADMGKVIGKAGATAKSLRTLLRGVGAKDDFAPLPLKIVDPQEEHGREHSHSQAAAEAPAEAPAAVAAEVVEEAPAAPAKDEHQELHDRTKREMEELADLEF